MYDYATQITEFIEQNFQSSNPDNCNVKFTNEQFLIFLFRVFPEGSISNYDLSEILLKLKYERFTYVVEHYVEAKKQKTEIHKTLEVGWCLKSNLDLHIEEVDKK